MDSNTLTIAVSIAGVLLSGFVSFVVANIRIGEYKGKVDTHHVDISEIKKEQKEVRDKVISCETSLREREPLGKRKSPISLTDRGNKVLNESGGKKFIDDNLSEFSSKVEAKEPKTSYDVQEISKEVISGLQNDDRVNPLKDYLFKEGMEIDDIIFVLGIYLRDRILEQKHWKVEDIDAHDPKNK